MANPKSRKKTTRKQVSGSTSSGVIAAGALSPNVSVGRAGQEELLDLLQPDSSSLGWTK